ncbi:MAG: AAA family ATPase [Candidatus Liptonbacteria bacterium]|nr:AAA family ATPase [Candidatus Liptonbacteria bacterium]
MHLLKRLELNGFKSFAAKTALDFPNGITAIVGPNGSGKSNVVDAIRWLLGERDAKHLRGGTVEDLIFSGTPERPRMGQAQASLHFENVGNFLPVDAHEVVIQRTVTRDGASRYFLNKAEILLRELVDFFARARLGNRGLIVVTQGNSDLFIRSEPRARREMIEEILGLREYQLKRADAERRLGQAQENMQKAEALIEEITPHLRSLRRQANRWEKRGAIAEELKQLENQYFGGEWAALEREWAALEGGMREHDAQGGALRASLVAAEEKQRAIEKSQPEGRKELSALRARMQSAAVRRAALEKQMAKLEAQAELAHRDEPDDGFPPAAEIMKVVERVRDMLLAAEDADLEALQTTIQSALEEIEALFARTAHRKAPKESGADVRGELERAAKDLAALDGEVSTLRAKEQELEKGQEDFYKTFTAAVREVERVGKELRAWEAVRQGQLLKKERVTLRREELLRQMEQAERKPEEFGGDEGSERNRDAVRVPRARGRRFEEGGGGPKSAYPRAFGENPDGVRHGAPHD